MVHKKDATHLDECSIFYFNIFLGMAMAGLLCLAAPWIAAFYERPILAPLTRVMSLNLVISAFGIVQITLLTKRLNHLFEIGLRNFTGRALNFQLL